MRFRREAVRTDIFLLVETYLFQSLVGFDILPMHQVVCYILQSIHSEIPLVVRQAVRRSCRIDVAPAVRRRPNLQQRTARHHTENHLAFTVLLRFARLLTRHLRPVIVVKQDTRQHLLCRVAGAVFGTVIVMPVEFGAYIIRQHRHRADAPVVFHIEVAESLRHRALQRLGGSRSRQWQSTKQNKHRCSLAPLKNPTSLFRDKQIQQHTDQQEDIARVGHGYAGGVMGQQQCTTACILVVRRLVEPPPAVAEDMIHRQFRRGSSVRRAD